MNELDLALYERIFIIINITEFSNDFESHLLWEKYKNVYFSLLFENV